MRENATLRAAAGSRGIDDASHIVFLAHDEVRCAFALEIFPAKSASQICTQRGLRDQDDLGADLVKRGELA